MNDFELLLCRKLVAAEDSARDVQRIHAKNTERLNEIWQNAETRADEAEAAVATYRERAEQAEREIERLQTEHTAHAEGLLFQVRRVNEALNNERAKQAHNPEVYAEGLAAGRKLERGEIIGELRANKIALERERVAFDLINGLLQALSLIEKRGPT